MKVYDKISDNDLGIAGFCFATPAMTQRNS
jgi:hypothetical protein